MARLRHKRVGTGSGGGCPPPSAVGEHGGRSSRCRHGTDGRRAGICGVSTVAAAGCDGQTPSGAVAISITAQSLGASVNYASVLPH